MEDAVNKILDHSSFKLETQIIDENYGNHISEESFYKYFVNAKKHYVTSFIQNVGLKDIDFITRSFTIKIHKELHHPSSLEIVVVAEDFQSIALSLEFHLLLNGKKIATGVFELIPVDVKSKKVITKSSLYEKFKINQLSL